MGGCVAVQYQQTPILEADFEDSGFIDFRNAQQMCERRHKCFPAHKCKAAAMSRCTEWDGQRCSLLDVIIACLQHWEVRFEHRSDENRQMTHELLDVLITARECLRHICNPTTPPPPPPPPQRKVSDCHPNAADQHSGAAAHQFPA
jgi:hypothetical protein